MRLEQSKTQIKKQKKKMCAFGSSCYYELPFDTLICVRPFDSPSRRSLSAWILHYYMRSKRNSHRMHNGQPTQKPATATMMHSYANILYVHSNCNCQQVSDVIFYFCFSFGFKITRKKEENKTAHTYIFPQ